MFCVKNGREAPTESPVNDPKYHTTEHFKNLTKCPHFGDTYISNT